MDEILGMFHGLYTGFGIAFSPINLLFALIGALLFRGREFRVKTPDGS